MGEVSRPVPGVVASFIDVIVGNMPRERPSRVGPAYVVLDGAVAIVVIAVYFYLVIERQVSPELSVRIIERGISIRGLKAAQPP